MNIYISKNNQTLGPYNEEQITQMIDAGSIGVNDMCSLDGSTWQHVSEFIQIDEEPKPQPKQIVKPSPKPKNQNLSKKSSAKKTLEAKSKKTKNVKPKKHSRSSHSNQSSRMSNSPSSKLSYLGRIRSESLYPNLRSFLKILFVINLVLGAFIILGGLVSISDVGFYSIFPIIGGLVMIFLSFVGKESAEVLIDIADSLIETNSKSN
jgi:hypothetical protein